LNGDGLADIAVFPETETSGIGTPIPTSHYYEWPGQAPRKTGSWLGFAPIEFQHPCSGRTLLGIYDLLGMKSANGKPLNSIVTYDASVTASGNLETSKCNALNGSDIHDGGLIFSNAGGTGGAFNKRYLPTRFNPPPYSVCDVDGDHF